MGYEYLLETTPNDISTLTEKELRSRVRTLSDVANKRIKRYESKPKDKRYYSFAYESYKTPPHFSTGGKTINQLRAEYKRVYKYLTAETSTQAGAKRIDTIVRERLGVDKNFDLSEYWKAYEKAESNFSEEVHNAGSETIQQRVVEWFTQNLDIHQKMTDYIEEKQEQEEADDTPDFVDEVYSGNA